MAAVLGITLKPAITKHAQTTGMFEQSHASVKQALSIETGQRLSLWHFIVNFAVLSYNTLHRAKIGN